MTTQKKIKGEKPTKQLSVTVLQPREGIKPAKIGAYEHLIEQVDAIRVETVYNASQVVLEGKLEIGNLLLKHDDLGVGVTELVQYVAKDANINQRDLWYCYKYAEQYDQLKMLPEYDTKIISWNRVKRMIADPKKDKKECRHKHIEMVAWCVDCGKRVETEHTH